MPKKRLKGTIISDKAEKSAVVEVEKVKNHPKYGKRVKVLKKYLVDNKNEFKKGDLVTIEESRPLSKRKRWIIVEKNN